jgi:hypothetical protein
MSAEDVRIDSEGLPDPASQVKATVVERRYSPRGNVAFVRFSVTKRDVAAKDRNFEPAVSRPHGGTSRPK